MNVRLAATLLVAGFAIAWTTVRADDITSGPKEKTGGPFQVKAITGEHRVGDKKEQLCYFCQFNAEAKPAVVMIFTQKADENLATLVRAVDAVQKNDKNLGTVCIGVSGVTDADLEKLQETYKLTCPLTVAIDKDGPEKYELNKEAVVTVLVYKKGGKIEKSFAFKDTKSAAAKAKDIATCATDALK